MKTVKDIAAETGKSKTAVMKKIDNLGLRSGLRKNGNQFAIDEEQEALIKSAFLEPESPTLRLLGDWISVLNEQLKVKDSLMAEQQKTIQDLTAANRELTAALEHTTASLHAAQALHAGTMQQQLTVDNTEKTPGTIDTGQNDKAAVEEQPVKEKWFNRLFKK